MPHPEPHCGHPTAEISSMKGTTPLKFVDPFGSRVPEWQERFPLTWQCMCKLLGATPRVGGFTPELRCVANADTCRFRLAALALNNQRPFARDLPTSLSTCDTLSRGMRPAFVRARMRAEHTTPAGVLDISDYGPLRMIMRPSRHAPVTSEQLVGRPL
jgi:hypothetical protein